MESCYVQQDRGRSGIYLGKGLSQKISGFYTKNNFSSIRGEKMDEKKTIDKFSEVRRYERNPF